MSSDITASQGSLNAKEGGSGVRIRGDSRTEAQLQRQRKFQKCSAASFEDGGRDHKARNAGGL